MGESPHLLKRKEYQEQQTTCQKPKWISMDVKSQFTQLHIYHEIFLINIEQNNNNNIHRMELLHNNNNNETKKR